MDRLGQQIRFCSSSDGTRIAYARSGNGPALVWVQHWVHHLEFDSNNPVWRPWLELLHRHHTVIRYDWRGCGLSDRNHVSFSFENYVADLAAVIEAAAIDKFALFGMAGAGSGIAMSYAVRHPERVNGLILQECHTKGRAAGDPAPERVDEAYARLKVIELGWSNDTPAYGQFFTALHIPDANAVQMRAYNDLLRRTTSPSNAIALLQSFWEADVSQVAEKVRRPTLVLHARHDSVIPFEEGRKVAALIPEARFVPIESRNHLLLNTEPAWPEFVEVLEEFLATCSVEPQASLLDELTPREREVLEVMAHGSDNDEIARRLKISEKTVRNQVSIIFNKLGISSRAQAVVVARNAGLGRRNIR
jgi:pimeloyl-ACP methyl ester carboxylesterase/DNA-binding CsgD family transcriptional regulator